MKFYLHTLEGKPAGFDGEQICYAGKGHDRWKAPLVQDLKTIREQQKKTFEYRKKNFKETFDKYQTTYDYVIVSLKNGY